MHAAAPGNWLTEMACEEAAEDAAWASVGQLPGGNSSATSAAEAKADQAVINEPFLPVPAGFKDDADTGQSHCPPSDSWGCLIAPVLVLPTTGSKAARAGGIPIWCAWQDSCPCEEKG